MSEFFLKIVNMSISASWLVLAVLLLRLILKKAPKWVNVLLWGIVAIRLICPISIESVLSLIPSTETVSPEIMMDRTPEISTGIDSFDAVVNPIITESFAPQPMASANPLQILIPVSANFWLLGIGIMLIYTAVSYLLLRRKVATAIRLEGNIYQSENVVSPFVLGIIKPKIYLPFRMDAGNLQHVIAHEQAHIRRKDHLWKPLGFLLLAIHWFNPLMWLGYVLLCKDIELACDEKVIEKMDSETKADYTQALVACSVNRRSIAACPLAFGEVDVKARVKSILHYKKPTFWIIVAAIVICAAVAVCFLTDPTAEYGVGIRAIGTGTTDEGTPAIILDYLFLLDGEEHFQGSWITILGEDEGEYTESGIGTYNGDLGKYRMMIKFKKTKAGAGFQRTHVPGQVYSLEKPSDKFWGELKYKVVYPPDYSLVIYIGSDTPFAHKNPALYNVRYLGGRMYIRLYNVWGYEQDLVAASGENTAPLLRIPAQRTVAESLPILQWLTICPGKDDLVPFTIFQDGEEVRGYYTVLDAQTLEPLKHFHPSGLDPQTYLFQNADPARSYIVLATFSTEPNAEIYAFGAKFPNSASENTGSAETFKGNLKTYYKNADGTWQCNGYNYKYRLEIDHSDTDTTFVYLSNLDAISPERAMMAAGLSSSLRDYFTPEEAVLVEWLVTIVPAQITGVTKATLELPHSWDVPRTVTDPEILGKIERILQRSEVLESGAGCLFTGKLTLTLTNGVTLTLTMSEDNCATWLSHETYYHYGQETPDGITGNDELYDLFTVQ